MAGGPLVSVVIPTWNRAALIDEAIASVEAQTYPHWELIVADDGSSDDTHDRLRQCGIPRLKVVSLPHSGNPARARNAGVAASSGRLVAFLDSDDLWHPHKLARQVAALDASGARWCYGDFGHVDPDGRSLPARAGRFEARNGMILEALLREETAAYVGTLVLERALFDEVGGFDEKLLLRADLDFGLRVAARAEAVAVAERLMSVRIHPSRMTDGVADPHEATARVFRQWLAPELEPRIRALARSRYRRVLWDGVKWRLRRREPVRAAALLARALAARFAR